MKFKLLKNKQRAQSCISGQRSRSNSRAQTPNQGTNNHSRNASIGSNGSAKRNRPVTTQGVSRTMSKSRMAQNNTMQDKSIGDNKFVSIANLVRD